MAKTWENYECTFNTENTSNTLPDSSYFVTRAGMQRAAFVNAGPGRPASQIVSGASSICYLDPNSGLSPAIMQQGDDRKITVTDVVGDTISVRVEGVPQGGRTDGTCSRVPANGLCTFDFVNNDGALSHIHVGHKVKSLSPGVSNAQIQSVNAALQTVRVQVAAKMEMLNELKGLDLRKSV
jgi:hypothetical protein